MAKKKKMRKGVEYKGKDTASARRAVAKLNAGPTGKVYRVDFKPGMEWVDLADRTEFVPSVDSIEDAHSINKRDFPRPGSPTNSTNRGVPLVKT